MSEKNRSIKKSVILTVCFLGVIVSSVILLLVIGTNRKVSQLCQKLDEINMKMERLQNNDGVISDKITIIENHIIPSDSIIECFVGHNPKVESGYVMIYKNSKLPLKKKNRVSIRNEKSKGCPSVELEVKENIYEKEIGTKAEMYINTETFKTLGIEGKGLEQGVFLMELRIIK